MSQRASGTLLHPTCLPSRGGIGDLGPAAYEFAEFLAAAKQTIWQILPLAPVGLGDSPYSALSAFAGNPLLISIERLVEHGSLDARVLESLPSAVAPIDFESVRSIKLPLLWQAAQNWLQHAAGEARARFDRFCQDNIWWLEDFVLYMAIRHHHGQVSWTDWPHDLAHRVPHALDSARQQYRDELAIERVIQFFFFEQWHALRAFCRQRGIRMVGDVAIFVNYDSADVWTHRDIFRLKDDLSPEAVAGVPPDAFSVTGQRWGNPLYRWDVLRERNFDWWVERLRWSLETCDVIRIDHFRGFESYWEVPADEETAVNGRWVSAPGDALFEALQQALGDLPFVAEDLGHITPAVHVLRDKFKLPGMKIMQFGFGNRGAHQYLPHKYQPNTVAYTGTHDNDTTLGWWNSRGDEERARVLGYLGNCDDGIHWGMIRALFSSVARWCVIPLQDVLGLGPEARMNRPSIPEGNWTWRYQPGCLTPQLARKLADLSYITDRNQPDLTPDQQGHGELTEKLSA